MKEFLIIGGVVLAGYAAYRYFNRINLNNTQAYKRGELPPVWHDVTWDSVLDPKGKDFIWSLDTNRPFPKAGGVCPPGYYYHKPSGILAVSHECIPNGHPRPTGVVTKI